MSSILQVSELEWLTTLMSFLLVLLALGTVLMSFVALRTTMHWLTMQVGARRGHNRTHDRGIDGVSIDFD